MLNLQIIGSEKILDFNLDTHLFFQKKIFKDVIVTLYLNFLWVLNFESRLGLISFEISGAQQACKYYVLLHEKCT